MNTKTSIDFKTQKIEMMMNDLTARGSINNNEINSTTPDPKMRANDESDEKFPDDNENLLPSQSVVVDEVAGLNMDEDTPKAFNLYRNKKLISHGLMDVALFSANANQLRYVLQSSDGSAIYVICIVLLLISIFLQILVGITLLLSARYNVTNCDQRKMAFKLGNYVIVGIFLITVVNIFITSFGGPSVTPPTILTNPSTELPEFINPI